MAILLQNNDHDQISIFFECKSGIERSHRRKTFNLKQIHVVLTLLLKCNKSHFNSIYFKFFVHIFRNKDDIAINIFLYFSHLIDRKYRNN